jgi:ferredoxin
MKQVSIGDSCVGCGSCVEICPEVFELDGEVAVVKRDADLSLNKKIIEAAEACPVEAIIYEK